MFALSDTREYSFTQVPYLNIEEKDNCPKELGYNVIVNLSPRNRIHSKNRQLKQKRRRRLQKSHFKVNSRCFKFVARIPPRSDVSKCFGGLKTKDYIEVQGKKRRALSFVFALCKA